MYICRGKPARIRQGYCGLQISSECRQTIAADPDVGGAFKALLAICTGRYEILLLACFIVVPASVTHTSLISI